MYLTAITVVLFLVWIYRRHRRMSILSRNGIPGPPPNFILGNIVEFTSKGILVCFNEWTKKYGSTVGFYLGGTPHIITTDVDLLRNIQVKDFHLFSSRNQIIKGGIHPTDEGQSMLVWTKDWHSQRTGLLYAFSAFKLKCMVNIMKSRINVYLDNIVTAGKSGENEIDIFPHFRQLGLSIMSHSGFGFNLDIDENSPLTKHLEECLDPKVDTVTGVLQIFFPELGWLLAPIHYYWMCFRTYMHWEDEGVVYSLMAKLISERRKMTNTSKNVDLMQIMLDSKLPIDANSEANVKLDAINGEEVTSVQTGSIPRFSENDLLGNAVLFLLAGWETTSTTLGYITHHLINFPDLQEKLRDEVKVLIAEDGDVNYNTVTKLHYMHAFINETLRIFPVMAPFTSRNSSTNYRYNGITIPKNAQVFAGVYQLQHDERYWPDAETFNPDRFLNNNAIKEPIAYQPFGAGPRNCIGYRFAMLELKLTLALMLLKFRLEPGPNSEIGKITVDGRFSTLIPSKGVKVKAIPL